MTAVFPIPPSMIISKRERDAWDEGREGEKVTFMRWAEFGGMEPFVGEQVKWAGLSEEGWRRDRE